MTKKREQDQVEPAKPVLSRRELLIRTGQVALVVGTADILVTVVSACGDGGGGGNGIGPNGGKQTCYPLAPQLYDEYDRQWAAEYGYTKYCYEVYQYDGETYGSYNVKSRALSLSEPPRYQRSE